MKKPYINTITSSFGRDCVLMMLFQLYGTKAGLFKVVCSSWVNMTPSYNHHIGRRAAPTLTYKSLATCLNNSKSKKCWYYHIDTDVTSFL